MKPRLLDLFCGAGGCARGYQRAGFYVVGVDVKPQPRYAGDEFVQGDALEVLRTLLAGGTVAGYRLEDFAVIHASPPCQMYSRSLKHLAAEQPMLIDDVRELLIESRLPWVIENVIGAPLPRQSDLLGNHGVELCGTMFGLRVWRHRLFETSCPVDPPRPCNHALAAMNPHNQAGRNLIYRDHGRSDPEVIWRREMGVEWMTKHEGRESVPPAMAEHIGSYLLAEIDARSVA